ncbi:MAG TPA: hypothetical protein VE422_42865 [Terriglobia bacterium]|nr:hypothetical protein [Terriglobia bacterium]
MKRRDFGLWGLDLGQDDFARAMAAVGVAAFRIGAGFGVDTLEDVVATLERELSAAEQVNRPVAWHPPFNLGTPDDWKLPSARMLADAWKLTLANRHAPVRIMIEVEVSFEDALWLVEQLGMREVGAASIFLRFFTESELRWNWPLRVGFLSDPDSRQLREKLRRNYWFASLWDAVNLEGNDLSCDLLLLPFGLRSALTAVLGNRRVRAECALVLGSVEESPVSTDVMIGTLFQQLQASSVGLASVRETSRLSWFNNLIDEIAHDQPLDLAIWAASRMTNTRTPLIIADSLLIELTRLSKRCELLGERLKSVAGDDVRIEISQKVADDLQLFQGSHPVRLVGEQLLMMAPRLRWDHESDSASTMAELERSAEPALELEPALEPPPRWIQARVFDCSNAAEPLELTAALHKNSPHKVQMQIGASAEGWIAAEVAFPAEQLPETKTGHDLTVVFSEPRLLGEPQVATISLPRTGNSTSCEFYFQTRADTNRVRARLTVLYENRVLQTAILGAAVVEKGVELPPDARIDVRVEAIIRPGMSGLNGRAPFDAALVLNHDDDQLGVTKIADHGASFRAPSGMDREIKWFDNKLSEVADDPDKFADGLKAKATVDVLRDLAKHGSLLYEAIVEDRISDDAIVRAKRLQVISAEPEARLPIEFLYDREAPAPDARLCDHALEALATGKCTDACPNKDDQGSVICPLGFWGLNRVIERHAFDKEVAASLANKDFSLQAEPVVNRRSLKPLTGALMGASSRVDNKLPGGVASVRTEIETVLKKNPRFVTKWNDWVHEIKAGSPSLLVLLVHTTLGDDNLQQIEIGDGQFLEVVDLREFYLRESKTKPPPLVLLIGCETGAPELTFHGFVAKLRCTGAAIVLSTGSTILGRHAVPVTRQFIHSMAELLHSPELSFGDVMLSVRQKLMAQGLLMVMCLMAYGDADWKLRAE